jgi:hypothetical protein
MPLRSMLPLMMLGAACNGTAGPGANDGSTDSGSSPGDASADGVVCDPPPDPPVPDVTQYLCDAGSQDAGGCYGDPFDYACRNQTTMGNCEDSGIDHPQGCQANLPTGSACTANLATCCSAIICYCQSQGWYCAL